MNPATLLLSLLAILAGTLFPIQTAINSRLAVGVGGPLPATLISFMAGFLALTTIVILTRQVPSLDTLRAVPVWTLLAGGLIGAVYLSLNVFLVPQIGAGAMMALAIAGQMLAALTIDRLGLFGVLTREVSLARAGGAVLVVIGAIMVRFL